MTPDEAVERRLAQLPRLTADPNRTERVRARCRAQLEKAARRRARGHAIAEFAAQVLVPATVGGVCVVWLAFLLAFAYELGTLPHPLH